MVEPVLNILRNHWIKYWFNQMCSFYTTQNMSTRSWFTWMERVWKLDVPDENAHFPVQRVHTIPSFYRVFHYGLSVAFDVADVAGWQTVWVFLSASIVSLRDLISLCWLVQFNLHECEGWCNMLCCHWGYMSMRSEAGRKSVKHPLGLSQMMSSRSPKTVKLCQREIDSLQWLSLMTSGSWNRS